MVLYLCACSSFCLAQDSRDLGVRELVPELVIPAQDLGFVQEDQSLGIVQLFTGQNGQTKQTSCHCFLVPEFLGRQKLT